MRGGSPEPPDGFGHFLTPDPSSYLGGINLYEYAGNNPVNAMDPLGLWEVSIGPSNAPWLAFDGDVVGGGLATGSAAMASSFSFGLYDGGKYKCDPSFSTSLGLANFGRDTLIGAVAPEAEGELAEGEVAEGADMTSSCLLCFPAGTPVQMADGTTKAVERLRVGDVVASRNPATGQDMPEPVVKTVARTADALVTVALVDPKTGHASSLTCTPEHPLYVHGKGFVPAGAVGVGSQIVTRAGPFLTVKSVSWKRAGGSGGYQVFNVEVQDTHSYFAGNLDGGVWVHNITCSLQRYLHILYRHGPNTGAGANRSIFFRNFNTGINDLIRSANRVAPTPQAATGNFQRVLNAGRDIGIDRATGAPTPIFSVITNPADEVVTAFPGLPAGATTSPLY